MSEQTPEMWQEALEQKAMTCACRFEWRPKPDFSGAPPKLLEECGYHATRSRTLAAQRTALLELADEMERTGRQGDSAKIRTILG